ncbi:GNAT family N-acetyltransferase [Actinomadura barringtoniae]|uniref:GNAT family N-acetyltransferase n=1 Tax=Actinomadura barringtoniae TaxID=1427535 RepID=A0A939T4D7_9ACTN|nr:GNAT family N-acetyltransferase [Actinomadura barringtoniae]MBO2445777.1 GNAT family N-acetyltransferase [Actinomadura barringtoniae]
MTPGTDSAASGVGSVVYGAGSAVSGISGAAASVAGTAPGISSAAFGASGTALGVGSMMPGTGTGSAASGTGSAASGTGSAASGIDSAAPGMGSAVSGEAVAVAPLGARVVALRAVRVEDAGALAELYVANREYLRPWEPERDETYFTVEGQRDNLLGLVAAHGGGEMWAGAILVDGEIAGRITLNNILRGPLQSCFVGYWVAQEQAGKGVGSEALRLALDLAFGELGLHRVEAFTRVDNEASQAVLRRNGFEPIGVARRHIHVAGRWHDERLFERLAPWDDGHALYPPSHSG